MAVHTPAVEKLSFGLENAAAQGELLVLVGGHLEAYAFSAHACADAP